MRGAIWVVVLGSAATAAVFGLLMVASLLTGQGDYKYDATMMLLHTIICLQVVILSRRP